MKQASRGLGLFLLFLGPLPALAGEPYLLKDINPEFAANGSEPRLLGAAGPRVVFTADDGVTGWQPWGSDGTLAGTERLAELCDGACGYRTSIFGRTDRLLFFRTTDSFEHELWATDGTRAGTVRLTSPPVNPLTGFGSFPGFASAPTQVYFIATDSVHGAELWRSDGTPRGTSMITDLRPGAAGSSIFSIATLGEKAVFIADDGRGESVWVSDGTPAGTRLLLDPNPRSAVQERPAHLHRAGSFIYFVANQGKQGTELWRTNGTVAGTVRVADLAPGAASLDFLAGGSLGDRLLFAAATPALGQELWISNGTKAGTFPLTNFTKADPFAYLGRFEPSFLPEVDLTTRALFAADDGAHGREVWATDGARTGARLVRDLCPGACPGAQFLYPARLGSLGFFKGDDGVHGFEPWATDGTDAGTRLVGDFCPGACSYLTPWLGTVGLSLGLLVETPAPGLELWAWRPGAPAATRIASFGERYYLNAGFDTLVLGRRLYLAAGTPELGREPWRSGLTPESTVLVRELNPFRDGVGSQPHGLMKLGDQALFLASAPDPAQQLWKSDGTEAGTQPITVAVDGPVQTGGPLDAGGGSELGSLALFGASDARSHLDLWRSDGSVAGTFPLLPPGTGLAGYGRVAEPAGARAYFSATTNEAGYEPWTTDGSLAGTRQLADLEPGPDGSSPSGFVALGDRVLFRAATRDSGLELWASDGTANGTRIVKDLTPSPGGSTSPTDFVVHGSRLFFATHTPPLGEGVWRTDGTPEGTALVIDGAAAPELFRLAPVATAGNELLLAAQLAAGGHALYASDGTPGNLRLILSLPVEDDSPRSWIRLGSRVFFIAGTGHLWVTDGTAGGTRRLQDAQGALIDDATALRAAGGRLGFVRFSAGLWITDGTPQGTRRVGDASLPWSADIVEVRGKLLFVGRAPETGAELWAVEP